MKLLLLLILLWSPCTYSGTDTNGPGSFEMDVLDSDDIHRLEKEQRHRLETAARKAQNQGMDQSDGNSGFLSVLGKKTVLLPGIGITVFLIIAALALKFRPVLACPKCGNKDRKLLQISPASAAGAFPWRKSNKYQCGSCGYRWRDMPR